MAGALDSPTAAHDLWIFAYGSLMWRPDFQYVQARRARLTGWHRRFCIVSRYYRGSAENPGLLLGLDRGGTCEGIAYRIAADRAREVLSYLRIREQISGVYREARVAIALHPIEDGAAPARQTAVVFLAEPAHPSFMPRLAMAQQARILANARGSTGSNFEYLANTVSELNRMGIRERELERLLALIGPVRATQIGGNGARVRLPLRRIPGWPLGPRYRLQDVKRFGHRSRMG
jgi:glutathione-specific gamma-glutamylcyclotransferase